jgi:hypothetical protein
VLGVCTIALAWSGLGGAAAGATAPPRELWLYHATNLADDAEVRRLETIWRRAAAAGYSHVLLADPKFARLGDMDASYFERAERVKRLAGQLGLVVVPGVFPVGRSSSMLAHDPDLAEGFPVRDAPFVVRGGIARAVTDPPLALGTPTWKDGSVRLEGGVASVHDPRERARFAFRLRTPRFRCYHVSVWIRTTDFTGTPLIQVLAGRKPIQLVKSLGARSTQPWTLHHLLFNSLDHDAIELFFGSWGAAKGRLEWRGWRIEEAGPVNLLRRPGAPFVVAGRVEGRDFEPVTDPSLGMTPWPGQFDVWHSPPPIRTSLPDGTRLRVSWYHAAVVYGGQVTCCISEPRVDSLLADEARRVRALWGPRAAMMMHDEIRTLNWDASCERRGRTPGALLADHARRCVRWLEGSTVYVWSDMFDPYHNAIRNFDLVRGDLAGSWEGLPRDVVIVNWNGSHRDASLRFFARRGHRQIIAGYFDGAPDDVRDWLRSARGVPGVIGVMYTTWRGRYDDLEAFARAVRSEP